MLRILTENNMNKDTYNGEFFRKNEDRFRKSADKIKSAYAYKNTEMPFLIYTMNYWLDGQSPSLIPDDYFDNPATMTMYQVEMMKKHIELFDDDFIPFLFPWFGTGVVPSSLGCEVNFLPKQDPALGPHLINNLSGIADLRKPDPYSSGLFPRVLKTIDFMRENTNLPVSITDPQGPLNIALSICGVENLFVWMCTNPNEVHQLMDFCTEVLINWITVQKEHAGQKLHSGAWPHGMLLPEGYGGVWLADDDCTQLSAELYKEFVVPYNSRVLQAFGGGTIHFCGSARHQIDNFLATEGISGINNFCMGDFGQVTEMQKKFKDKLALMVCDFAPYDIDGYFMELLPQLNIKGTILGSYIVSEYALKEGKYKIISRDADKAGNEIYKIINNYY